MDQDPLTVGERLRTARLDANLTQEAVAQRLGVAHKTWCRWEYGETATLAFLLRPGRAEEIAEALETTPEYILDGIGATRSPLEQMLVELSAKVDRLTQMLEGE